MLCLASSPGILALHPLFLLCTFEACFTLLMPRVLDFQDRSTTIVSSSHCACAQRLCQGWPAGRGSLLSHVCHDPANVERIECKPDSAERCQYPQRLCCWQFPRRSSVEEVVIRCVSRWGSLLFFSSTEPDSWSAPMGAWQPFVIAI